MSLSRCRLLRIVVVFFAGTSSGQLLSPLGSVTILLGGLIGQMSFDPTGKALYLPDYMTDTIHRVSTTVPAMRITPLAYASWQPTQVAGGGSVVGPAGETSPTAVAFNRPTAVLGWPSYAVGPFNSSNDALGAAWVGLWVCDWARHVIRFINFRRGNNVTIVAGSGVSGAQDGMGTAAMLNFPRYLAWGRFPRSLVHDDGAAGAPPSFCNERPLPWISMVLWSEGSCIRQGVPLNNRTLSLLNGSTTEESLADMVLNVTSFVGSCGPHSVSSVVDGPAYLQPVLFGPAGVALVNPFPQLPASTASTMVLFLIDSDGGTSSRLAMVTSLFPRSTRYLTVIAAIPGQLTGVTIARVISPAAVAVGVVSTSTTTIFTAHVELHLATESSNVTNASVGLRWDARTGTTEVTTNDTQRLAAMTTLSRTKSVTMVRYAPNSTTNGTLVVFSGAGTSSLQFYCCLGPEYSAPVELQDSAGGRCAPTTTVSVSNRRPTATPTSRTATSSSVPSFPPQGRLPHPTRASRAPTRHGHRSAAHTPQHSPSTSPSSEVSQATPSTTTTTTLPYATTSLLVRRYLPQNTSSNQTLLLPDDAGVQVTPAGQLQVMVAAVPSMAVGAAVSGLSTARALGVLSVGRRCYDLLLRRIRSDAAWNSNSSAAVNDTGAASNASLYLSFPDSAWPGFRVGEDDHGYERGAAVAGATTVVVTAAVALLMLAVGLLLLKPAPLRGMRKLAVRVPMMIVVSVVGLLSDGTVGAAALVGGAFTLVGCIAPLVVIILVGAAGWRRVSYFDPSFVKQTGPRFKVEAFRAVRGTMFRRMFEWFVGVGAWRLPLGATPAEELRGLEAPAALIGRVRGPSKHPATTGNTASGEKRRRDIIRTLSVYYLALDVLLAAALSLARGLLVNISCTVAVGVVTGICGTSLLVLVVMRPLTAPAKNAVAVLLAAANTAASVTLFVGVWMMSASIIRTAIRTAEWAATASVLGLITSMISLALRWSMYRGVRRLAAAAAASLEVPMLAVPAAVKSRPPQDGSSGLTPAATRTPPPAVANPLNAA